MSRQKGTPKTGGRKKGTPNKTTKELRKWISELLDENREQIKEDLKAVEPYQRIMIFEKFLSYTVPKLQSVEANIDLSNLTDEQIDEIIKKITVNI